MDIFTSQLINGLSVSSTLFISAIGLVIIFGLLDVVNMAHGEFIMIGAYFAYFTSTVLKLPFAVSIIASFIFTAILGIIIETLLIKRLYGKVPETLLATFALSYIFQQIIKMIFGPEDKFVGNPLEGSLKFGDVVIPYYNIFLVAIAVIILLVTLALFFKTTFGMQIRAITRNRSMSQCLGLNTARIDTLTFAYGSGLAGVAGALLAPVKSVMPSMGIGYQVDGFLTVTLGGLNSIIGAFTSSFVISESVTLMSGYISEITAKILVFMLIIILIRFKPEGLFALKERR
ncbi:high-affinity branched-chain amino acid transport system permease protein LivH [Clostridium homopropionicum DSM 5847]|uniref:High-affinity branched-chain amino acid transport system permease protein LivH n=1 Tax=Clostridium homopropionicum DSM 5847 TaxID=1121318 RepID=A0A0L6ZAT1_9CLOT|nr:urea ABC transporter permease subunit UrtB [Clostridium homopropionicum]KOA20084.1 high-affinity branched-chain amino acid transport system permease protein LivH [Clostridium homopropionicum DSM 5847]SFG86224.1 urea transport system permease protein [Clostridium homopropionicum]